MLRLYCRHTSSSLSLCRSVTRSKLFRASQRRHVTDASSFGGQSATSLPPPPPPGNSNGNTKNWRRTRTAVSYTITAIKFLAVVHLFSSKVLMIGVCDGPSMLPTLGPDMRSVLMNHMCARGRGVQVGDLVTACRPDALNIMMLKRVIGMPGDYVVVDPMAPAKGEQTMMVQVPPGHCWIAGDNMGYSVDSRFYGPVPLGLIKSKVIAQLSGPFIWFKNPLTHVNIWD